MQWGFLGRQEAFDSANDDSKRSEVCYLRVRAKQGEGAGGGSRVGVTLDTDFSTDSVPTAYTISMI